MPTDPTPQKSTTVRTAGSTAAPTVRLRLMLLRSAFAVLDRAAPSLAGRWALRIWCTVPGGTRRHQDNRPHPGQRGTVPLNGEPGTDVVVERWEPASGAADRTVYLIHGWGGWRGQLGSFVTPLLDAGARVVAFDVPSHGESSASALGPRRATALDFVNALTSVAAEHGEPDGVIAHSLGSATTALAVRDGLPARRLAFIAPSPDPIAATQQLQQVLGYGPRTRKHFFAQLERLARRPLIDFNALLASPDADLPPALVVHDRQDKETSYDDGARLAATWPEAELVTTEGLGHQRILLDDGVIKAVADYLTRSETRTQGPARGDLPST